jgi:DHA1 family inner membrane transport protein
VSPARKALLALAVGAFGLATGEFVTLGLLPEMAAGLDVSIPKAGWLISAYALGVVVGAPLLTAVSVRLPRKGLLIGLALILAAGNVLSALAPGFGLVLAARFLAGLPHGAYFGVASVVAAGLVREQKRSQAMAVVFAGLTVANIVGVPLTTFVGQATSWRLVYGLVAVVEVLAALLIAFVVPVLRTESVPRLRPELAAFANKQIWLSLGVATVGGGAMFASISYIAPMMTDLAGYAASSITWLLVLIGVGMTAGNLIGARLADRNLMRTVYLGLTLEIVIAIVFFFTAHNKITAALTIPLFAFATSLMLPAIQSRLVTLAGGAPNLAAASMHSAFNVANSIGAWLGGAAIAAGFGYGSPNLVAAGLAALGLLIALFSGRLAARALHAPAHDGEEVTDRRVPAGL